MGQGLTGQACISSYWPQLDLQIKANDFLLSIFDGVVGRWVDFGDLNAAEWAILHLCELKQIGFGGMQEGRRCAGKLKVGLAGARA